MLADGCRLIAATVKLSWELSVCYRSVIINHGHQPVVLKQPVILTHPHVQSNGVLTNTTNMIQSKPNGIPFRCLCTQKSESGEDMHVHVTHSNNKLEVRTSQSFLLLEVC